MIKVVKFGGSSLADATQFGKVADIIHADPSRVFVVPSAPGRRYPTDTKVTDMLLKAYDLAAAGSGELDARLDAIRERYDAIISGLSLDFSLDGEFAEIRKNLKEHPERDYAASRGEYLNGLVMAA